jgi:hypothetical protein
LLPPRTGAQVVIDTLLAVLIHCGSEALTFHSGDASLIEAATRPLIHSSIED